MLIKKSCRTSVDEVSRKIQEATIANGFGVMTVHDLKETMKNKGVEYNGECRIFEVCNPQKAKQVIEEEPLISTMLPCRISVFRKGDHLVVATFRPTWMIDAFERPGLKTVAEEVERVLEAIIDSAVG